MHIESPFATNNEDDFVVTDDMLDVEIPDLETTPPSPKEEPTTPAQPPYTKKDKKNIISFSGYFTGYNSYINALKDDLSSVLKGQFGVSTNQKIVFEEFMLEYIKLATKDFHSSQKKFQVLCSIIDSSKTPQSITQQEIAKARTVPISNFISFNRGLFHTCIFHKEKTASMKYNPSTNTVKCFGCGKFSDVITVYQHLRGVTFKEAVKELCQQ